MLDRPTKETPNEQWRVGRDTAPGTTQVEASAGAHLKPQTNLEHVTANSHQLSINVGNPCHTGHPHIERQLCPKQLDHTGNALLSERR
jgi:hypothetical protein